VAVARTGRHGISETQPVSEVHIWKMWPTGRAFTGSRAGSAELDDIVCTSLRRAGLWNEVKDRLSRPGTSLSAVSSNGYVSPAPLPCSPNDSDG